MKNIMTGILVYCLLMIWNLPILIAQPMINIQDVQNNISRYLDTTIIIEGVVDQHIDDVGDLGAYIVRDRFNNMMRVRTSNSKPPLNTSLRLTGIFTEGAAVRGDRTFFLLESNREFTEIGGGNVTLALRSVPSGATILLNNENMGSTPASIVLPQDRNVILQLKKNFYNDEFVSITTGRENLSREVVLNRSSLFYASTFLGIGLVLALIGILWFATNPATNAGNSNIMSTSSARSEYRNANVSSSGRSEYAEVSKNKTAESKPEATVIENKTIKLNIVQGKTIKVRKGYFSVVDGITEPKEIRLYINPQTGSNEYTFGREDLNSINHFQLKDMTVSRKQAVLVAEDEGQYTLVNNAKSDSNPTRVNDEEMAPYESRALNHGDLVQMGNVKLEFRLK